MSDVPSTTRGHRLLEEIKAYLGLSLYLYVCFTAVLLYKASILEEHGVTYAPYGLAAMKALILGKFILLAQALRVGERGVGHLPLVLRLAYGSVMLLIVLVLLSVVEEAVAGLIHGRTVAQSVGEAVFGAWFEIAASCLLMWLILVPYLAYRMVREALGPEAWRRLLSGRAG